MLLKIHNEGFKNNQLEKSKKRQDKKPLLKLDLKNLRKIFAVSLVVLNLFSSNFIQCKAIKHTDWKNNIFYSELVIGLACIFIAQQNFKFNNEENRKLMNSINSINSINSMPIVVKSKIEEIKNQSRDNRKMFKIFNVCRFFGIPGSEMPNVVSGQTSKIYFIGSSESEKTKIFEDLKLNSYNCLVEEVNSNFFKWDFWNFNNKCASPGCFRLRNYYHMHNIGIIEVFSDFYYMFNNKYVYLNYLLTSRKQANIIVLVVNTKKLEMEIKKAEKILQKVFSNKLCNNDALLVVAVGSLGTSQINTLNAFMKKIETKKVNIIFPDTNANFFNINSFSREPEFRRLVDALSAIGALKGFGYSA